jgi:undecaprenyl-diphosphatase
MSTDTPLQDLSIGADGALVRKTRNPAWLFRLRPGLIWTLVWIAMGCAAVYFLAPQIGELRDSLRSLRTVQPGWLAVGVGLVSLRYALAAITLRVAVDGSLAILPTTFVQVSSSFVGRLTPEGIGWLVLNQRYLEQSGLERSSAVSAITLKVAAGAVTRLLIMALVAILVGTGGIFKFETPFSWPFIVAIALGVVILALVVRAAFGSRAARVAAPVVSGLRNLMGVLRQPKRAATLFGASAGVSLSYPLVLMASLMALGVEFTFLEILAVYLGGTAVASTSPTPGNLGAVEAALAAGLITAGVAAGPATAAVLLYRLLTFWLPVLPGFIAFRYLQQNGHL